MDRFLVILPDLDFEVFCRPDLDLSFSVNTNNRETLTQENSPALLFNILLLCKLICRFSAGFHYSPQSVLLRVVFSSVVVSVLQRCPESLF